MSNKSGTDSQVIALPKGGGALQGIGETFSADLFSGTGHLKIPLRLLPGRRGIEPQLHLAYSSGSGNGPFGMGWDVGVPTVSRKTSSGVPRYRDDAAGPDAQDTFILSGAEDLVPVATTGSGAVLYRPRTEGLFARIERIRNGADDFWRVRTRDGAVSIYGTPGRAGGDDAVVADPSDPRRVFSWKLSRTADPFGNQIVYDYLKDLGGSESDPWAQLYVQRIRYIDVGDGADTRFLASVTFDYGERADHFALRRAGFEIRTRLRCRRVEVRTHAADDVLVRSYELRYIDERVEAGELPREHLAVNGTSLLSQVRLNGHTPDNEQQSLPPIEFVYARFETGDRQPLALTARNGALPAESLASDDLELVALFGNGLPDIVQMNGQVQFWRNLGGGGFDAPQMMDEVPAGVHLRDPGVRFGDFNGDGRADLLALGLGGYFPLSFGGRWSREGFVQYEHLPSFDLQAPDVRLVDLDGDGVVDALRTGPAFELFFNDPVRGWESVEVVERRPLEEFPDLNFSDPRVKLGDLTGDSLQDFVLVDEARIDYWPSFGHGRWGRRRTMTSSPIFQAVEPGQAFDPRRVLLGDIDGDGVDDLVYVSFDRVTFWLNQSGNGWSEPVTIEGTPPFTDIDAVRLVDLLGTGALGLLWTDEGIGQSGFQFLELAGPAKPYTLVEVNNHLGAITRIEYAPSTDFYRADFGDVGTRWSTPLPFPVPVVRRVDITDQVSEATLSTEYRYRHGYWDGNEREFRGFGVVEQLDAQIGAPAGPLSAPIISRTWFHLGPVGDESGPREEADLSASHWPGDPSAFTPVATPLPDALPTRHRADALRSLRGSILRTELYVADGSAAAARPVTVTESRYGVREEAPPPGASTERRVFFPHLIAARTTQWERGDDPMTSFRFLDDYDSYGQPRSETRHAVPRGRDFRREGPVGDPYLGTQTVRTYAQRDDAERLMVDRVAAVTTSEVVNDGHLSVFDLHRAVLDGQAGLAPVAQTLYHYDGPPFVGLEPGTLGEFGAPVRVEQLVLTEDVVRAAYAGDGGPAPTGTVPPYLVTGGPPPWTEDYPTDFRGRLPSLAGYRFESGDAGRLRGYFVDDVRTRYDFHDDPASGRGLATVQRDALGGDLVTTYDDFALLPVAVRDAGGLTTSAEYDYRVMQPTTVVDPNGNRTRSAFTPLGLLRSRQVLGKDHEEIGDVSQASLSFEYDFAAFERHAQPISVRSIQLEHHDTEVPGADDGARAALETIEYSDGLGRLIQTRTQAEGVVFGDADQPAPLFGGAVLPPAAAGTEAAAAPVTAHSRAADAPPNVVVSGWQRYDHKGRVVGKFEPFFASGWAYRSPDEERDATGRDVLGQQATTTYDALGRVVRTVEPDGSERRIVQGVPGSIDQPQPADPDRFEPSPWEAYIYDASDNAGRTGHGTAKHAHSHDTPTSILLDGLGRTIRTIERNRQPADPTTGEVPPLEEVVTTQAFDIRGNVVALTDTTGRVVCREIYDVVGRIWRVDHSDAGTRRILIDASGNEIERRDGRGALVLQAYDALHRAVRVWARDGADEPVTLRERLVYGDNESAPPSAAAANVAGRLFKHYDEAGLTTFDRYDFKGNLVERERRVISDSVLLAVLGTSGTAPTPLAVDWEPPEGRTLADLESSLLGPEAHRVSLAYDALNRARQLDLPAGIDGRRRRVRPDYNEAGALRRVTLDDDVFVDHIAYNAKGQRTLITLGCGVMTRYGYDEATFRLARLRSEPFTRPTDNLAPCQPAGAPLQDSAYAYDPGGNLVEIVEHANGTGVRANPDAAAFPGTELGSALARGDALLRVFGYDALSRLVSATGRECRGPVPDPPWSDGPLCGFNFGAPGVPDAQNAPDLTVTYRETYAYDTVGNLELRRHQAAGAGTTTRFQHVAGSNRLEALTIGADDRRFSYVYDAAGQLVAENRDRRFGWDHSGRMAAFQVRAGEDNPSVQALYLYDAAGVRVKKLIRFQGGSMLSTSYVDGIFEHHRWSFPDGRRGEYNDIHVMDDEERIAGVRVGQPHPDDRSPSVRYVLADHLGSSQVVVGGAEAAAQNFVNREEYTPHGITSFGGFGRKRYRFTGKERDEETGFSYHGARYYAPWLGRWTSCEPNGASSAINLYTYAGKNPIRIVDPSGLEDNEPRFSLTLGLTLTFGTLEKGVSTWAAATAQLPIGAVGIEGGARGELSLYSQKMGVRSPGAVGSLSYFAGASVGEWNTTDTKLPGVPGGALNFHGSGMTTNDTRVALGWGRTSFHSLRLSTGLADKPTLGIGLRGHTLDQTVGTSYVRWDRGAESYKLHLGNDVAKFPFYGGGSDWFETMNGGLSLAGRTGSGGRIEGGWNLRALTDPIVHRPDKNGTLTRQSTGPEPGAPNGYYLTHRIGANAFAASYHLTISEPGSFSVSVAGGATEPEIQKGQELIHDLPSIDASYFRRESKRGLFHQIDISGMASPSR